MAECPFDYCADPIGEHILNPCDETVKGGLPSLILFDCPPSDPSDVEEIAAMKEAGTAHLWCGLRAGLPASSPEEIDPLTSCGEPIVINEARTATLFDANVSQNNVLFWNAAKKRKFKAALFSNCDSENAVYVVANEIRVRGNLIYPDRNNDVARFEGSLTWRSLNDPTLVTSPDGAFC